MHIETGIYLEIGLAKNSFMKPPKVGSMKITSVLLEFVVKFYLTSFVMHCNPECICVIMLSLRY